MPICRQEVGNGDYDKLMVTTTNCGTFQLQNEKSFDIGALETSNEKILFYWPFCPHSLIYCSYWLTQAITPIPRNLRAKPKLAFLIKCQGINPKAWRLVFRQSSSISRLDVKILNKNFCNGLHQLQQEKNSADLYQLKPNPRKDSRILFLFSYPLSATVSNRFTTQKILEKSNKPLLAPLWYKTSM